MAFIDQLTDISINHTSLNFPLIRNCDTDFAFGQSGNKSSNLNELKCDLKFCEIEAEDFQVTIHILLA